MSQKPHGTSWLCPFCGRHATIGASNRSSAISTFDDQNKYGGQHVQWTAVTCPNEDCREYVLSVQVRDFDAPRGVFRSAVPRYEWQLVPAAKMKILPDYIPAPIREDYREACLIAELSPKASATLSRRCLQGMIRNFWGVSLGRLVDEIDAISDKVDPLARQAIDALRRMGNIGAHMEKDINVIVEVDANEARLLIGLIETLIDDWYVARHQRESRLNALVEMVNEKLPPKAPGA